MYFSTSEFSFPYLLYTVLLVMHISGMVVKLAGAGWEKPRMNKSCVCWRIGIHGFNFSCLFSHLIMIFQVHRLYYMK